MAPERQERIRKRTQELLAELPLQELRQARALSQEELAEVLGLNQATISKLERRTDMYLSSLRRFVEAMGGELEVTAKFPEGKVRIQLFEELEEDGDLVYEITVNPDDLGRVIGKGGRVANAIRAIAKAAAVREQRRVLVDILD